MHVKKINHMQEIKLIPKHQEIFNKILVAHSQSYDAFFNALKNADLDWKEFNHLLGVLYEMRSGGYIDDHDQEILKRLIEKIDHKTSYNDEINEEGKRNRPRASLVLDSKPSFRSI